MLNSKAIKLTRLYLDISQKEFAKKAGISPTFLGQVEMGAMPISPDVNKKLVEAFEREGVSEEGIFQLVTTIHDVTKQAQKNKQKGKGKENANT